MTINGEVVDSTNQGSNGWKQSLDGAGLSSMALSGSGLFDNSAGLLSAQSHCLAKTSANYQISDGIHTYTGSYRITKMERDGDYKGEQTWSMTLESNGLITVV